MKKRLLFLLLLVLAGSGIYYVNSKKAEENSTKSQLTLYGNVDIRDVALSFRVFGRMESMYFEEGDRVKAGEVVAVLDKIPFEEALALCEAELAEAAAILDNAEKLHGRRSKLVKSGAVSHGEYDDALAARDEAKAKYETTKAKRAQAVTRLNDTEIRSPSDGIIMTRVREPGSVVGEGTPVCTLALDTPVWVRTYIDEPNLGKIRQGQKALVFTDSGGKYEGQIGFISPQAEFTPKNVETTQLRTDLVYRLRVVVNTPDSGLRQGMPVTVIIER